MSSADSDAALPRVHGGIPLATMAAEARELSKANFVAQHSYPFLVIELPAEQAHERRGFRTVYLERSRAKKTRTTAPQVVCPVTKRGLDAPAMVTVGRTRAADIFLDDPAISKLHAYFARDPLRGEYHLADAGSTNGTTVNGKKLLAKQPCKLKGGERLEFGRCFSATFLMPAKLYDLLRSLR